MSNKQAVYNKLETLGIPYEVVNHDAVHTMEDMFAIGLDKKGTLCKNLFVRDVKGKNHFLIVLSGEKQANLIKIADQIGSTKLSFASADRLQKHLQLTQGSVSPFGIINDSEQAVEVVFDKDLQNQQSLGFHPNDNTSTVFLSFDSIKNLIQENENPIKMIKI